ncbi:hypothetical protein G443_001492 [Actinoalloteichus cyanogriseus DSM 43889]|uniref:Uncharacterized protein n=1 Tax=Actinoalloteichus caeruleus DSM 43889 TaxID=1120930 RepID=A0ABT1JFF2_ACTCY|nr:hypothetical protein [Actinoalloteichus caeruleus DSM 43889]
MIGVHAERPVAATNVDGGGRGLLASGNGVGDRRAACAGPVAAGAGNRLRRRVRGRIGGR